MMGYDEKNITQSVVRQPQLAGGVCVCKLYEELVSKAWNSAADREKRLRLASVPLTFFSISVLGKGES